MALGVRLLIRSRPLLLCRALQSGSPSFSSSSVPTNENGIKIKSRKESKYPRIYTRTGDKGTSSLFTGERREKSDAIFEALGTTDELSSHIGLSYAYAAENGHPYLDHLQRIQCLLQDIGSNIATPKSSAREAHLRKTPEFSSRHTEELEEMIDEYSKNLPPLKNFILPGGGQTSSSLHVARSVCRRCERRITPLVMEGQMDEEALKYLNRLSDFLFTIARFAARFDKMEETIYTQPGQESNYESGTDGVWKIKKKSKGKHSD